MMCTNCVLPNEGQVEYITWIVNWPTYVDPFSARYPPLEPKYSVKI